MLMQRMLAFTALTTLAACLAGCGNANTAPAADQAGAPHGGSAHAHDAWWCNEHGVPEEECALCDPRLVATFKSQGDWCAMHERPDSQCFACHPERQTEYAARYEAKYGKQPPAPEM